MSDTNGEPCYYCGRPVDVFAGNPGRWPLVFCHDDLPGQPRAHHVACVTDRLERLAAYQLRARGKKTSGYDDEWTWHWACEVSASGFCEYNTLEDTCHDTCLHCGQPEERK